MALSSVQVRALIAAARFALESGRPFNRHVTIHWEVAGIHDSEAAQATGAYLKLIRDWLASSRRTPAWLWVRENGEGKGSHVHILLHIPGGAHWTGTRMKRWLALITGKPYVRSTIQTRRIAGSIGSRAYQANLGTVLAYVIKGASPEAAARFNLDRLEAGGRITGKRCGWSQNIGAARRSNDTQGLSAAHDWALALAGQPNATR